MKRIILILLFLAALVSISAQGRYPFHTNRATSTTREDIHYLFNNSTDNETSEGAWINTGMDFSTSSPPEGTHWANAASGSGDYFQLPTSYTNSFPADFSISFFFKTPTNGTNIRMIESGSAGSTGFAARMNSTGQDFDVFTNSTELNATNFAGFSPSNNQTFHFMLTYESSTGYVYIYVDGVEENDASPELGASGITLTGDWFIMNFALGQMDDFRIFPEILDGTDATWLNNNAGTPLP